ncbi:glycosyltransferase family 2 protein [Flavobacterium sp. DG1-102-2]|uniref:glycosyltransferase family 2 protein n=1 Tax=Flavobacterium sp. DG1-102-2 TaxID=3081663 RepID=UPI0029499C6C|nr:glycosyltransferase family 2 protein [Flavobacterium sp. DG1-102-2]MDV6168122.1 glycosyltransferase family 2 protein [Flavobacterium sp. DG1-102-2]
MPFFSVVIPLYNKENFIAETLNSVLAQTFTDFEVIVVDDVSTDGSISVVEKIKDDRIRIIRHEKNKGLSASRNTGIKNADSEMIAFLDADDLWKEEFLESMAGLSKKYPQASMYASKYEEVYNEVYVEHDFSAQEGLVHDFFINNLNQTIYYPSSLCVKKEAFDVIGHYDESITFAEDLDFNIRAHLAVKMAYANRPLMIYRMASENQITHSGLKNRSITDFDKYEALYPARKDLKKYLDFHRYIMAKHYKLDANTQGYKKMLKGIDLSSLNYKQIVLLYAPAFILRAIKRIKGLLIKNGLNPTSY